MAEGSEPLFVNIRTNQAIPISAIIAAGFTCNVRTFTGNDTYTPSTGLIYAKVKIQAAGGGSGGADGVSVGLEGVASGAGGAGEYAEGVFTAAQIGASQTITIGAVGTAGNNTGGNGGNAATSSFGALMTAIGGSGGTGTGPDSVTPGPRAGGAGGSGGTGGYLHVPGQNGGYSSEASDDATFGNPMPGIGGNSFLGTGAVPPGGMLSVPPVAAQVGNNYGGGASGAFVNSNSGITGAAGGPAIIIVEEYIFAL